MNVTHISSNKTIFTLKKTKSSFLYCFMYIVFFYIALVGTLYSFMYAEICIFYYISSIHSCKKYKDWIWWGLKTCLGAYDASVVLSSKLFKCLFWGIHLGILLSCQVKPKKVGNMGSWGSAKGWEWNKWGELWPLWTGHFVHQAKQTLPEHVSYLHQIDTHC